MFCEGPSLFPLNSAQQNQDEKNYEYESEATGWVRAPACAIGPCRQSTDQKQFARLPPCVLPSPEKLPRLKRTFAPRPIANIAVSTGWRAPRCGTAWIATDEPCHTGTSKHSSRRVRSLEARWKVEGKAVSEITVASSRPKRRAFDASTLRLLEELCEFYVGDCPNRHPFGIRTKTMNSGTNFPGNFLSSLRILT